MKTCITCKIEKVLTEFGAYKKAKDGLQARCKDCKREYDNTYYVNNESRRLEMLKKNHRRRQTVKEFVREYLRTHPCVDCGEADIRVLDFDHVRGEKTANVSELIRHGNSIKRVMEEIDKCEVRCANDHRRITAERAGWYLA